jgi:membrane-bound serine protease (ClpP class)
MTAGQPDVALLVLTLGILLIYWELCAPGRVVPGAAGALLVSAAGWSFAHQQITREGLFLLGSGAVLQVLTILNGKIGLFFLPALFCWCAGSVMLLRSPDALWPFLALPASLLLSIVSLWLGRLAVLGYRRKRNIADSAF